MGAVYLGPPAVPYPVIPGFFDPGSPTWPVPMVRVALFLPGISRQWAGVNFLLDTGAGATILHPADAIINVGLDPAVLANATLWQHRVPIQGVGGSNTCYRQPVLYVFMDAASAPKLISGEIVIAPPHQGNQTLPSLLGWDVLQQFRLNIDWAGRCVELHEPPPPQSPAPPSP